MEHVYELRKRVFYVALVLVVTSVAGLEIKDQLIAVIVAPLHGQKLIYLTPGGGFNFIFTLSIYFGALLTIPFAVYHLYRFLQPLLKRPSRRFTIIFLLVSLLLASLGAFLGYFLAIPGAINFLNNVGGTTITPSLTADSYLRFVVTYVVGLAIIFQIPLVLFLFDHIRPIPPGKIASTQRYAIIASTILAALVTPSPDLTNYFMVLVPIIAIYEIGVLAVYLRRRAGKKKRVSDPLQRSIAPEKGPEDEPLTAIIEELQSSPEAEEPAPIIVTEELQPVAAPSIAEPKNVKSIDGFGVRTRPPATRVSVPQRPVTVRPQPPRTSSRRPSRSLDGFSIIG